jgi:hypothetical protein
MVLYMWGGRTVLVFVTAPCAVGTQAAKISAAVATSLSVTEIFVLLGLPGLQQPNVTLFKLQMCKHADIKWYTSASGLCRC